MANLRLVLNIKRIPFETVWVPLSEIGTKAREVGADPTSEYTDGSPRFTVPFIVIETKESKTVLSDSSKIARFHDEIVPEPPLFPQRTAVLDSIAEQYVTGMIIAKLRPIFILHIVAAFDQESAEFFKRTRHLIKGGQPFEQLIPRDEQEAAQARKDMLAAFDDLAAHLDTIGGTRFRLTPDVSYAEITLVALLHVFRAVAEHSKAGGERAGDWAALAAANGGRWQKLLEVPEYRETKSLYLA